MIHACELIHEYNVDFMTLSGDMTVTKQSITLFIVD
jgi:hypothetical protein